MSSPRSGPCSLAKAHIIESPQRHETEGAQLMPEGVQAEDGESLVNSTLGSASNWLFHTVSDSTTPQR